jgi:hypothetical protein
MASRLFHAIVGVGIGLGAATAACLGAVEGSPGEAIGPDDPPPGVEPVAPPVGPTAPAQPDAGASPDARRHDAARDAPRDAILDAFCDAAWPTTKGNPTVPACVDRIACAGANGDPFACRASRAPGICDGTTDLVPSVCAAGQWACPTGTIQYFDCRCLEPPPPGKVCTATGLVDAGGD